MADEWWPHVSHFIDDAIQYSDGKYDLDSVYTLVKKGEMQLWVVMNDAVLAAGTTQVCQYPLKKVCILVFAGGFDMASWKHTLGTLEKVAQEWGCDSLEIHGRKGWLKVLPEYEQVHVTLRKDLWPRSAVDKYVTTATVVHEQIYESV